MQIIQNYMLNYLLTFKNIYECDEQILKLDLLFFDDSVSKIKIINQMNLLVLNV